MATYSNLVSYEPDSEDQPPPPRIGLATLFPEPPCSSVTSSRRIPDKTQPIQKDHK